ncbi:MAG: hypothetical protein WBC93_23115, partial [Sulfitobacter sp.]
ALPSSGRTVMPREIMGRKQNLSKIHDVWVRNFKYFSVKTIKNTSNSVVISVKHKIWGPMPPGLRCKKVP